MKNKNELNFKDLKMTCPTDIFNFDVALQQQQTEYWKVHRDSWAQELAKIKYTVNVTSSVDRVQQEASPAF